MDQVKRERTKNPYARGTRNNEQWRAGYLWVVGLQAWPEFGAKEGSSLLAYADGMRASVKDYWPPVADEGGGA